MPGNRIISFFHVVSPQQEIKQLKSSQVDIKHDHYLSHKDESYSKDGMEFEDPEFFQMTISKLKQELEEVKKECQYWKDAARNQVFFQNS